MAGTDKPGPVIPHRPRSFRSSIKGEKVEVFGGRRIEPGFAQSEPPEPEEARPEADRGKAHYGGESDAQAAETWKAETLCLGCYSAPVCRHFAGMEQALITVTRCLAYIPAPRQG